VARGADAAAETVGGDHEVRRDLLVVNPGFDAVGVFADLGE